jgi:hypothetical protein
MPGRPGFNVRDALGSVMFEPLARIVAGAAAAGRTRTSCTLWRRYCRALDGA